MAEKQQSKTIFVIGRNRCGPKGDCTTHS